MIPNSPEEKRILKRLAQLDRDREARARRTPHKFEEAHDDPAPATHCWECRLPRGAKIHKVPR